MWGVSVGCQYRRARFRETFIESSVRRDAGPSLLLVRASQQQGSQPFSSQPVGQSTVSWSISYSDVSVCVGSDLHQDIVGQPGVLLQQIFPKMGPLC